MLDGRQFGYRCAIGAGSLEGGEVVETEKNVFEFLSKRAIARKSELLINSNE